MKDCTAQSRRAAGVSWLTLFTSSGTLVCCALPIILVTLGMGATVAALTSTFPFLIYLSLHKTWVFSLSAAMLALSAWLIYRPGQYCPSDPELARICEVSKIWNKRIYWFAFVIWCTGFFAAYIALPLRIALDI